jgi:hypothetical protein
LILVNCAYNSLLFSSLSYFASFHFVSIHLQTSLCPVCLLPSVC